FKNNIAHQQDMKGDTLKKTIFFAILLMIVSGCTAISEGEYTQDVPPSSQNTVEVEGLQDIILTADDIQQFNLQPLEDPCVVLNHQTSEFAPLAQSSSCHYTLNSDGTIISIILQKFTNAD